MAEALDAHARTLSSLHVDRSEIVNAIVAGFFEENGTPAAVREAVARRRAEQGEGSDAPGRGPG